MSDEKKGANCMPLFFLPHPSLCWGRGFGEEGEKKKIENKFGVYMFRIACVERNTTTPTPPQKWE